jgi:threonine aldolase
MIDLRSDTVTHPTPEMRNAMANAEVGDDVYGEDPTVNRLEETFAELTGKEAGLFVASGTMGNLIALMTHGGRGQEAIVGKRSHIFLGEQGGVSSLAGLLPITIDEEADGRLDLGKIQAELHGEDDDRARTRLVCIENTHNFAGGRVLPRQYMDEVGDFAHANRLALHVDGARIFNASVALGVPTQDLVAAADSVQLCLSKGLACPVGSVVTGSAAFISEARRVRKMVGGGMRQAGVIAAAGLVAAERMIERLAEDHANARRLAEGLADVPGVSVDPNVVETNILNIELASRLTAEELTARLAEESVRISATTYPKMRLVTHYEVSAADVKHAIEAFSKVLDGN